MQDPPLEPEPPTSANAPHPCPLPAIGGASPKREIYDIRDNHRLSGDIPGPTEALGPPSPARGSAGVCAPQPPPVAPRRARLGKAMARRSLAGDDTGLLLSVPQPSQAHHSDADDDVMAISPPICAPIDLSSSDERSTPLVDVKKENEGPTCATSRKPDAQALREHNCSAAVSETTENTDAAKAVKRRHSRPKLEIDMIDTQLEESCKTNGIGEHVKLQKRRKVSGDQAPITRIETVTKETKKRTPQTNKRKPKSPTEKKSLKRRLDSAATSPKAKRMLMESIDESSRLKNVAAIPEDLTTTKPKTKSALLLDNLIRKNSVDAKGYTSDKELNPAELFLPSSENVSQTCSKKTLNINNNIVDNNVPVSGVRPNTIAAVSQLIEKKLAYKNACKMEKVDSKITHSLKSVLKTPTDKLKLNDNLMHLSAKCKTKSEKDSDIKSSETGKDMLSESLKDNVNDLVSVSDKNSDAVEDTLKSIKIGKVEKPKTVLHKIELDEESHSLVNTSEKTECEFQDRMRESSEDKSSDTSKSNLIKISNKSNGHIKTKSIEKVAKLLVSKKPFPQIDDSSLEDESAKHSKEKIENIITKVSEKEIPDKVAAKRCNASIDNDNGERKSKSIEKVAKLLVSKKPRAVSHDTGLVTNDQHQTQSSDATIDSTIERPIPEKTLPKRCKLSNGELKGKHVEKVVKLLVSKKPAIKTDEATLVIEDACASPLPTVGRRARRRRSGAGTRRIRRPPLPLAPPTMEPRAPPRWSNGWQWDSENYLSKVYLNVSRPYQKEDNRLLVADSIAKEVINGSVVDINLSIGHPPIVGDLCCDKLTHNFLVSLVNMSYS